MKNEIKDYILSVVCGCETVIMSTINSRGFPEARAIENLRSSKLYPKNKILFEDNLNLYLSTGATSSKIGQIKSNNKVSIYCFDPEKHSAISLFGKVEIVADKKLKDAFWPADGSWDSFFKDGKDDKDYCIIKFVAESYKFYDSNFKLNEGSV
ncbi:pyridoxamine 5'-phosphate oxidase [Bacilli bacterium]|nr:pyridoxamine 5'-phosphate oxidase [Bacilli bacterium]